MNPNLLLKNVKSKSAILFLTLLYCTTFHGTYAQFAGCDCSAPLSKDLADIFKTNQYRDFKDWLYRYMKSDSETRQNMKTSAGLSFGSVLTTVVEALPVKESLNFGASYSDEDQLYTRLQKEFAQNGYISDQEFNSLIATKMSDNQLKAYQACLNACDRFSAKGLTIQAVGDVTNEFYIHIKFRSTPSGGEIRIKGNATHQNLEPIDGLILREPTTIKDGASIVQFFKRVDPTKSASFSFATFEDIDITPITFQAIPKINTQQIPVGAIVSSVLQYKAFLQANGLPYDTDMSSAIWVPCDGRKLNSSKYAQYGTVPDLRGLFQRGANDYGELYSGVGVVSKERMNPANMNAGDFQQDALKVHFHEFGTNDAPPLDFSNGSQPPRTKNTGNAKAKTFDSEGDVETRPRNLTVYYYLKIN